MNPSPLLLLLRHLRHQQQVLLQLRPQRVLLRLLRRFSNAFTNSLSSISESSLKASISWSVLSFAMIFSLGNDFYR